MADFTIESLAWDSEFLGFSVARLTLLDAASLPAALSECRAQNIKLLYISLPPDGETAASVVRQAGGLLADCKLTYRISLADAPSAIDLRPGSKLEVAHIYTPALEALAWQSGEFSRFRLDKQFAPNVFERLYSQWLRNGLANPANTALTVYFDNIQEPTGLLLLGQKDGLADVELLAVAASQRGQGLGQLLLQAACATARQQGHRTLQVVTQRANQPACRLYERFGFKLWQEVALYHLWL